MKTVIINGQNHQGSSYHIGHLITNRLMSNGALKKDDITEFFLPRDLKSFCLGCYKCLDDEKKCPQYGEKNRIEEAIKEAELLIFTTPTYCLRASAPMKNYIDLNFINWMPHRPKPYMFTKKAVIVSTAAGAGTRTAIKDVKKCLFYCGVPYIKTLGAISQAVAWEKVETKRQKRITVRAHKLADKIAAKGKVRTGLKTKFIFMMMRLSMKGQNYETTEMKGDLIYWRANGWLEKNRPWKE